MASGKTKNVDGCGYPFNIMAKLTCRRYAGEGLPVIA